MHKIIKQTVNDSFENVISSIKEKISSDDKEWTENVLNGYLTDNRKKKELICALSVFLEEKENTSNTEELIRKKIFETSFDIEHIHANADNSVSIDEELQNSIGNLVMLESEINRSVQATSFNEKKKQYKKSKYLSVKNISNKEKWAEEEIIERRNNEVKKILDYIFNE
jgi:hypothetical protein